MKDNLGDRMKEYENVNRIYLTRRVPTIIRLDGKSFHTFTRGFRRPFDILFMKSMQDTAKYLCENIAGCQLAYTQSDEITLLLTDDQNITTEAWFDKNIQKMASVSASMATMAFNKNFQIRAEGFVQDCAHDFYTTGETEPGAEELCKIYTKRINTAMFDSRVFNLPKEEVCNCFIWRQQDATRNAIQMVGRAHFSHKEMNGKSCDKVQEMLWQQKNINFNDLPIDQKRGSCIKRILQTTEGPDGEVFLRTSWEIDTEIPVFTQDRDYIDRWLK